MPINLHREVAASLSCGDPWKMKDTTEPLPAFYFLDPPAEWLSEHPTCFPAGTFPPFCVSSSYPLPLLHGVGGWDPIARRVWSRGDAGGIGRSLCRATSSSRLRHGRTATLTTLLVLWCFGNRHGFRPGHWSHCFPLSIRCLSLGTYQG